MIRKADELTPENPFDVRTLAASHVGYFSRPRLFAALLAELAQATSMQQGLKVVAELDER